MPFPSFSPGQCRLAESKGYILPGGRLTHPDPPDIQRHLSGQAVCGKIRKNALSSTRNISSEINGLLH